MACKLALEAIGYHYNTCGVVVEACLALRKANKTVQGDKGVKPILAKCA